MTEEENPHYVTATVTGTANISAFCRGYVSSRIATQQERIDELLEDAKIHVENARHNSEQALRNLEDIGKMNRHHARVNVIMSLFNIVLLIYYLSLINQQNGMFDQLGEFLGQIR